MNVYLGSTHLSHPVPVPTGFRIAEEDRLVIEGKQFRFAGMSGRNVVLRPATDNGMTEQFPMETLSRLSAAGKIQHDVGYYLPDHLKSCKIAPGVSYDGLSKGQEERLGIRCAIVQAIEEIIFEGIIRNNDDDIQAHKSEIRERTADYLIDQADQRAMNAHEARRNGEIVRAKRGNKRAESIALPCASTMRKMVAAHRKYGRAGLADDLSRSGNRSSYFLPEEEWLLMDAIQGSYLTLERKSQAATVLDVRRAFLKENVRREKEGLSLLRVPGRDAVRSRIKKLNRLVVMIARWGRDEAMKRLRPVGKGLEVERPLQRVEIDEWKINLHSIIHSARLHAAFGTDFLEAVGLNDEVARWWLVAAIDCRTRVIVGMKLTRNPKASAAIECLRMITTDKGQWADAVGSLAPWHHAGPPETLVSDNGPAFKASEFTRACNDLGITLLRTIAGLPGMRGTIERLFLTAAIKLMERLKGRTFSDVIERGNHPSEERACLDAEDLAFALVRWVGARAQGTTDV